MRPIKHQDASNASNQSLGRFKVDLKRPKASSKRPKASRTLQGHSRTHKCVFWSHLEPGGLEPPYIYLLTYETITER